jgi:hypothetical protein
MEDKDVQVIVMDSPSPASSAMSSSSSTSDSDSGSEVHNSASIQQEDKEHCTPEMEAEEGDEEEHGDERNNMVLFRRDLPPIISRSTSPLEINEERCSGEEYPLSQRVYSSSSCGISAGLQQQCYDLWNQFDSIGTEMIVTRRGR